MKLYFLIFSLSVSSTLLAQKNSGSTDSLITVTREKYSIQSPKEWIIDTSKMFGMDILLRSPKKDSLDNFFENINVFVQDLKGYNYTLSKMGQESEAQVKNMVTDLELVKQA